MSGWMKHKQELRLPGKISVTSDTQMTPSLRQQRGTKEPLDEGESEKAGLKLNIQKLKIMGWEDPLEKGMATHSSTLAWRIPWREEPGRLQSMGLQRVRND